MELSLEDQRLLAPYVTSLSDPVFALRNLPEEVVAVLFAYYSRSQDDLRTNLLRLLRQGDLELARGTPAPDPEAASLETARQRAREFHEKWVVGYGHASVAEHAVAHLALEDVSIIASKLVEHSRLASYTEKSTRYVPFPRRYHTPVNLPAPERTEFENAVGRLFDAYQELLPELTGRVMAEGDPAAFRTERGYRSACQARACDALRALLPAATCTNLGLTANARTLEGMISRLLSHPLVEARQLGERIQAAAAPAIPTLIKHARPSDYARETPPAMRRLAAELLSGCEESPAPASGSVVRLVAAPEDAEQRLAAAILHEHSEVGYDRVWSRLSAAPRDAARRVIREYLARRRIHGSQEHGYQDPPLRGVEHASFTFEVLVDYGAYRDIQRHRMATQSVQRLGCLHGYEVPQLITRYGLQDRYQELMERAAASWQRLEAAAPEEAQYAVPLAYRLRMLITWNLRAMAHFITLRSARQGHPSYRRVAWQVHDCLLERFPALAELIRCDREEYEFARPG